LIKIELTIRNLLQNLTRASIYIASIRSIERRELLPFNHRSIGYENKNAAVAATAFRENFCLLHTLATFFLEPHGSELVRKGNTVAYSERVRCSYKERS